MAGVVDLLKSPIVAGWVDDPDGDAVIEARRGGDLLSSTPANLPRTDLASRENVKGFSLKIPGGFDLRELADGVLEIVLRSTSCTTALRCWRPLEIACRLDSIASGPIDQALTYLDAGSRARLRTAFSPAAEAEGSHGQNDAGSISDDDAAIIGLQGHLFLYQGSNRVADLYRRAIAPEEHVEAWLTVIGARAEKARSLSTEFQQILIPEKSTAVAELCPYDARGGSPLFRRVCDELEKTTALNLNFINGAKVFAAAPAPDATFRAEDSHLSTYGCSLLCEAMLGSDVWREVFRPAETQWSTRMGDLGRRFADPAGRKERVAVFPALRDADGETLEPDLHYQLDPLSGHQGIVRHWRCDAAPIEKKVLCFGNSFFERGNTSTALSWWCARLFKEFNFVWDAAVDWDLVEAYKPDLLICQTIERFLGRCPVT